MQIPFHKPYITNNEIEAAVETIKNGWLTMGHKTFEFEKSFASYTDCKFSIALNSCTAALHFALLCNNLKPGDKVIIPVNTFVATAEVICYLNAIPVFCDIEKDTHNIDVSKIEGLIDKDVKGIIAVHYSGQPCDMDEIIEIANKYKLFLIEDAAHAFPSEYKGQKIGSISDYTAFSFYATKTIAAGEGGCLNVKESDASDKLKHLRLHGISKDAWKRYTNEGTWKYDVVDLGYKYNPNDIAMAIAKEQLDKTYDLLEMRKKISDCYDEAFDESPYFEIYNIKKDRKSSYHLYPLKINIESITISRDIFIEELKIAGVNTSVHFIPLNKFSYYKNFVISQDFPNSEYVYNRQISLPIWPGMKENEINYVIKTVLSIAEKYKR